MKKILLGMALVLTTSSVFAAWDNWSANYNDEIPGCTMGTANRKTKSSRADGSMTINKNGNQISLVIRSDKWMRHGQPERNQTDIIVNFGKRDGQFRDTFLSIGRGGYLLDITSNFSTFLLALSDNSSVSFTPIGSPILPTITVPLSGKKSKAAVRAFAECLRGEM